MRKLAVLAALCAALAGIPGALAQTPASAKCASGIAAPAVQQARTALERDPAALEERFRLASALLDQQCYEEAVQVLEAGEATNPQNAALAARLRAARSMISEQRYIEGVTQAEESAKLQRNLFRCKKLADLSACDEALKSRRNDPELNAARADAALRQGKTAEVPAAPVKAVMPAPPPVKPRVAAAAKPKVPLYSNDAPPGQSH